MNVVELCLALLLAVVVGDALSRVLPAVGERVEPDSRVTLVISSGGITVEDVVGKTGLEAQPIIIGQGLEVVTEERQTGDGAPGVVLEQNPAAGEQVDPGSTVTLVIAAALPEPTEEPAPPADGTDPGDGTPPSASPAPGAPGAQRPTQPPAG